MKSFLCAASTAGNCQKRTPTSTSPSRRRAPRRSGWVGTMRSFCGASRPAPSCPPPPPHCTALSPPHLCPHPHSCPPHLWQAATPPLTVTAVPSRLNTAPRPTEPPQIKISPRDQPHPLTGQQTIRIIPLARPHPHTERQPIAVTLLLVSALCRDKLHISLFFLTFTFIRFILLLPFLFWMWMTLSDMLEENGLQSSQDKTVSSQVSTAGGVHRVKHNTRRNNTDK